MDDFVLASIHVHRVSNVQSDRCSRCIAIVGFRHCPRGLVSINVHLHLSVGGTARRKRSGYLFVVHVPLSLKESEGVGLGSMPRFVSHTTRQQHWPLTRPTIGITPTLKPYTSSQECPARSLRNLTQGPVTVIVPQHQPKAGLQETQGPREGRCHGPLLGSLAIFQFV